MDVWVREEIDYRISKIRISYYTSNKKYHYNKIVELFNKYPELHKYYDLDDKQYYYDDRITPRKLEAFELEKEESFDGHGNYTPEHSWQLSDEDFGGLYFVGDIGYNPIIDKKLFMVKIGQTENIKKRMAQYRTHNPNFWHENCSLKIDSSEDRNYLEELAHKALSKISLTKCPNADEWFIVSEENYFNLCKVCSHEPSFYDFIKTGE